MSDRINNEELNHLKKSIELAKQARERGNHPFGALIVTKTGMIFGAENEVLTSKDWTEHAELRAIKQAMNERKATSIEGATLFASAEPCAMCTGAIYWSGIGKVVFSLPASVLSVYAGLELQFACENILKTAKRQVEVIGSILINEGAQVHNGFWDN